MATPPRPLLAVDVDGVLRPVPRWHGDEVPGPIALEGFERHTVVVPNDRVPRSPFHSRPQDGEDLAVEAWLNPSHGQWLRRMAQHCDLVWATTWEHSANLIGGRLRLPELPVGLSVETNPPSRHHVREGDVGGWKESALLVNFPNRPVIWIDDMAPRPSPAWADRGYEKMPEVAVSDTAEGRALRSALEDIAHSDPSIDATDLTNLPPVEMFRVGWGSPAPMPQREYEDRVFTPVEWARFVRLESLRRLGLTGVREADMEYTDWLRLTDYRDQMVAESRERTTSRSPWLRIAPCANDGLTAADMRRVENWLDALSAGATLL